MEQDPQSNPSQEAAAQVAACAPHPPTAFLTLVIAAPDSFVLGHQAMGASYTVMPPGVLKNDYPEYGVTAELVTQPASGQGTVTMNGNGGFSYSPPNQNFVGTVTFTYRTRHSSGTVSAAVTVTLKIVNHSPEASPNWYLFVGGQPSYTVAVDRGLLITDYDPQGNLPLGIMLRAELATPASNGTLGLNFDGSFNYSPGSLSAPANDSFTYRAKDSAGALSAAATVTLTFI